MPSLNFVLPHWLYWGTLIVFPIIAIALVALQKRRGEPRGPSLFIAYVFWLCAGFVGLHRFYLRSAWGFVFVPVFLLILHTTDTIRDHREDVSRTRAAVEHAHHDVDRAKPSGNETPSPAAAERLAKAQAESKKAESDFAIEQAHLEQWRSYSRWLALMMAAMLVVDAVLLPWAVQRAKLREETERRPAPVEVPEVAPIGTHEDPTLGMHNWLTDAIEWVNVRAGTFVAYWAVISVFVYYYEVIARFAFNSPTNWVHESMFLMYGMHYMIAGAYAYREDQHVRVDVFYSKFSPRGKAIADIITSVFFFIFIGTMFWTSWRFAADAVNLHEVSFTEWGVQYWPVKVMMPIGAGLLLLQGVAKLIKDILLLKRGQDA